MRLPALLISLVPFLPSQFQSSSVVCVTALGIIPAAVGTVLFTAMLADVVAPKDRPQVVSVRNALLSMATTVAVLVAGKALDVLPFPASYQLIFALAFVASLISLYYLGRISIPESEKPTASHQKVLRDWIRYGLCALADFSPSSIRSRGLRVLGRHWVIPGPRLTSVTKQ